MLHLTLLLLKHIKIIMGHIFLPENIVPCEIQTLDMVQGEYDLLRQQTLYYYQFSCSLGITESLLLVIYS